MRKLVTRGIKAVPQSFIYFVIIGFVSFLVDYSFYLLFIRLGLIIHIAKASSSVIAIGCNYTLNTRYNFGKRRERSRYFLINFFVLYALLTVINVLLNALFFALFGNIHAAVLSALVLSAFFNYFWVRRLFARWETGPKELP